MKFLKVGDVSVQVRGVSYDKSVVRTQPSPGYLPLLRGGNIGNHGLIWDDLQYVPESIVSAAQVLRAGDVVLAASSGSLSVVGKAATFDRALPATFGAFCKTLRPNEGVNAGYFGHYFRTMSYRRQVSGLAEGANINNLRKEHLDNLVFPLPPLDEQRRIAAILDKADEVRSKRREALANLDALTRSIFQSMFGDAHKNPMHWPTHALGVLLEFGPQNGMYLPASEYGTGAPIVRIDSFRGGVVNDLSSLKRLRASQTDLLTYGLRAGDILINRVNSIEHLGKSAVVPKLKEPTVFESNMMRCRFDSNRIHPEYLRAALTSDYMYAQIVRRAKRAVNQASINQTDVKEMSIRVPPLELQQTFTTRVAAVERLKENHRKHLTELDALFASLQHRAFKGEL